MWWCVTAVDRMLQPAKSPWLANLACVTTALKTATWLTQSQPQKSQRCLEKTMQKQQQESQHSLAFGQPFDVGSCANMYGLPKSKSPPIFNLFGPSLTKVNTGQTCLETLATVNSSFFPRVNRNCFQGARNKSEEEMMCEDEMSEKVLQHWLYLYQSLRCVTHLLEV